MAFLPGLCKHLLGEELKIPSVATWWCGQDEAREHVLENLDRLPVRPAFRWDAPEPEPLLKLERRAARGAQAAHRISAASVCGAGTSRAFHRSVAGGPDGLTPRPVALRVYLVAMDGAYKAMPGGLTRVAAARRMAHAFDAAWRREQGHLGVER